jgi:hypothetical protein
VSGEERALVGLARELLADFEYGAGRPRLPEEKLLSWAERFAAGVDDARGLATDLVAFALKLTREAGDAGVEAIGQLLALAGVVLGDANRAAEMFGAAGVDVDKVAARATGFAASKIPVGAGGRVAGATSPLETRLPKKK